jgi:hypothetical protein
MNDPFGTIILIVGGLILAFIWSIPYEPKEAEIRAAKLHYERHFGRPFPKSDEQNQDEQ